MKNTKMSKKAFRKAFYKQIKSAYKYADRMLFTTEEEAEEIPQEV